MTDIPPNVLIDDLKPSRFLKVTDLVDRWKVPQLIVTVSRLAYEETIPVAKEIDPGTRKPKGVLAPVLYFLDKHGNQYPRGMILGARINTQSLKQATGAKTVGELIGKKITIMVGEHKSQPVLRISPTPPTE
jgi:hypothetical protein